MLRGPAKARAVCPRESKSLYCFVAKQSSQEWSDQRWESSAADAPCQIYLYRPVHRPPPPLAASSPLQVFLPSASRAPASRCRGVPESRCRCPTGCRAEEQGQGAKCNAVHGKSRCNSAGEEGQGSYCTKIKCRLKILKQDLTLKLGSTLGIVCR